MNVSRGRAPFSDEFVGPLLGAGRRTPFPPHGEKRRRMGGICIPCFTDDKQTRIGERAGHRICSSHTHTPDKAELDVSFYF